MANQLELSESEMQYYEEAVNELAEQVDQLREENATVQQQKNDLEAELVKFKSSHSSLQDDFNALTRVNNRHLHPHTLIPPSPPHFTPALPCV